MKKYFYHAIPTGCLAIFLSMMPGCKKAADITISSAKPEKAMETFFGNDISVNRPPVIHLYGDTVYTLSVSLTRELGEQLIIDEGTVIKVNGSASITIKPGGILQATGGPDRPIVFTSNVVAGNQNLNWGGIVIQGKSTDNAAGQAGNAADFSGTLRYVRIEFAGLTLTAVGNRTLIENVQVSYAYPQSSFEFDGGTFNAQNLVSYACGGVADLYITRGYTGKLQQVLAYRHPFFGPTGNTVTGVFIGNNPDNPGAKPNTAPVLSNVTVLGPDGQNGSSSIYGDSNRRSAALVTTNNALFHIRNSLFLGFPEGCWYLDDAQTADAIRFGRAEAGYSVFQSMDSTRAFYLSPGVYPPFNGGDFKTFMLGGSFSNKLFAGSRDFMFRDPFNYDRPDLLPGDNAVVLTGSNFDGAYFSDVFFKKIAYRGALGTDDWLKGWTNFTPLKTNYNFPQ